tara:strand:+ start:102 stop:386 length:285 start_codon:yes stop_codon:yes gene_type:complete
MQQIFESTPQQKQLADIGRSMMDYSEQYGKLHGLKPLKDAGLRILNDLSHTGGKLTRFGTTFGTNAKSFGEDERELMVKFNSGQITHEYLIGLK